MAVRIRMKKMGRKHRPFYRICAVDGRRPRNGRVLEELGTYDPMVTEVDARALLKAERVDYWLGVGAQPSDKVKVLIKKYGTGGTHLTQQGEARQRLAMPRIVPDAGKPAYVPPEPEPAKTAEETKPPEEKPAVAQQPAAETPAEAIAEAPAEAQAADQPAVTDAPAEEAEASAENEPTEETKKE